MGWLARSAEKRVDPANVLAGVRTVVVLGAAYRGPGAPPAAGFGMTAAYARHNDYHHVLDGPLRDIAAFIDAEASGRSLWYVDTGPVLERDLAQRAGAGFVGKHTNLVGERLGNWLLLAEILTTAELPPDKPGRNHCGRCRACLDACPTGALPAPFTLDARRCISYLTIELKGPIPEELRPLIGTRVFGCDDCLAACPWNRFARDGRLMLAASRPDLGALDLLELLALDEAGFRRKFAGTPMARTKRRGLRRNACVALGNSAGPEALPALATAMGDPDPLVAEHAEWAMREVTARVAKL
jgi:epoxyqueuosine reductase